MMAERYIARRVRASCCLMATTLGLEYAAEVRFPAVTVPRLLKALGAEVRWVFAALVILELPPSPSAGC